MGTATVAIESKAVERMLTAAREAGCPEDQVRAFLAAGVVLQPKQWAASAAARECDKPGGPTMVGIGGARGGGKSFWSVAQIAVDDCQRVPGLKCLILRKVGKAARESVKDLLPQVLHGVPHRYVEGTSTIEFPNGSRIILGHYQAEKDIDAYLGLEYDVIAVEEATTLTLQKVKNIRTCNRTSKPNWRPRMYLTTNPGGIGHAWFKAMFVDPYRRHAEKDTRFVPSTVDDNCFVDADYRGKLDVLTGWQKSAWRDGNWDISAGAFFTTWRREVHVVRPFDVPSHWRVWAALDYGFAHFTVYLLLAQDDDGTIYLVDEHAARGWLIPQHIEAIRSLLIRNGIPMSRLLRTVAGADVFARRVEQGGEAPTIAEKYKALGIELTPANIDRVNGAAQILGLLGDVERGIPPRMFVSERCVKVIEQLPEMQHDPNHPEDVLKVDVDEDGNGGDDGYDVARYGVMAAPAAIKPRQQQQRRVLGRGGQIG